MDVFISYNWGVKKQVKSLFDILTSLKYQVWLDEKDLNGGNSALTAELAKGIKQSKVFVSCLNLFHLAILDNLNWLMHQITRSLAF